MFRYNLFIFLSLIYFFVPGASAQNVNGVVTDSKTNEPLIGVNILVEGHGGTSTDLDGRFILNLENGEYNILVSYLGYQTKTESIVISTDQIYDLSFMLKPSSRELDMVVVSGGKFERKITEETVSIDVLNVELLQRTNSVRLNDAIEKVPGVTLLDGQATIRGGSGYAYGAGSRVMVVVDDMPMITADRGDIRWSSIPMEVAEQVEVMKGAASSLYGASALNGVINIRTAFPGSEPETRVNLFYGITDNPPREETKWWDYPPYEAGLSIAHLQRFGRFDLVLSAFATQKKGHLRLEDDNIYRVNFKTRYRPESIEGLSFGINGNVTYSDEGEFFFWENASEGAYIPSGSEGPDSRGTLYRGRRTNFNIDPYVTYFDSRGNRHSLRSRIYTLWQYYSRGGYATASIINAEYQFQRTFANDWTWTSGVGNNYFFTLNKDLGDNTGNLSSIFTQLDMKIKDLTLVAGFRWEVFNLNDSLGASLPVGRLGLNYPVTRTTHMRASIGQGYRFPSIAERFVETDVGDISIFPNPDLKPEYGYSAELGVKQSIAIRNWSSYLDLALFWTDYWEMTEFQIGVYPPPGQPPSPNYIGFRSENVSRARIAGFELGWLGEGSLSENTDMRFYGGYTYVYPADLTADTLLAKGDVFADRFINDFLVRNNENVDGLLKYRYRHMVKADVEFDWKQFTFGFDTRFYSYIENIDQIFLIFIPDIAEYRENESRTGNWVFGLRLGYQVNDMINVRFIANNILNREYYIRPAKLEQPRNYLMQLSFNF